MKQRSAVEREFRWFASLLIAGKLADATGLCGKIVGRRLNNLMVKLRALQHG